MSNSRSFASSFCIALSLFCTFVVSSFGGFNVSKFRCFVFSLFRTFVVSYFCCFLLSQFKQQRNCQTTINNATAKQRKEDAKQRDYGTKKLRNNETAKGRDGLIRTPYNTQHFDVFSEGGLCTEEGITNSYSVNCKDAEVTSLNQTLWPDHCVMYTKGANVTSQLTKQPGDIYIHKGYNCEVVLVISTCT